MRQAESLPIPTLTDVLVRGDPARARAPDAAIDVPMLTDVLAPANPARMMEAETVVVEPVPTPDVPATELPPGTPDGHRAAGTDADPAGPVTEAPDHDRTTFVDESSDAYRAALAADLPNAHPAMPPAGSHDEQAPAQDAPASVTLTPEHAEQVAERVRHRLTAFLTGEGREMIEARCRDALRDHTAWLVSRVTLEVALALETEVREWVRDAIDDEIARRDAGAASAARDEDGAAPSR